MNHFKTPQNQAGFMLVEVVIAVVILGVAITALVDFQSNMLNKVWRAGSYCEQVIKLRNIFYDADNKEMLTGDTRQMQIKKTTDFSQAKYEVVPVSRSSSLHSRFPDIYLAKCSGSWLGLGLQLDEELVRFMHILPKKEPQ